MKLMSIIVFLLLLRADSSKMMYFQICETHSKIPSFTQGFIEDEGFLWESSGLYEKSYLRKTNITSKKVEEIFLKDVFLEGISIIDQYVYALTWKENKLLKINKKTLEIKETYHYPLEGWGMTVYKGQLMTSDGSEVLYLLDKDYQPHPFLKVTYNGQWVKNINAIYYDGKSIYANIWPKSYIYKIDPENGFVVGVINLSIISNKIAKKSIEDVLNGLYINQERLHITGKNWNQYFTLSLNKSCP